MSKIDFENDYFFIFKILQYTMKFNIKYSIFMGEIEK